MKKTLNDFTVDKTYQKGDVLPATEVNRIFNQIRDLTEATQDNTTDLGTKVDNDTLTAKIDELKQGGFMEICVSKKKITKETKISEFPVGKFCINIIQGQDAETSGFNEFAGKAIFIMTNNLNGAESGYQLIRVEGDNNIYSRLYDNVSTGWKAIEKIGSDLNIVPASEITSEAYDEVTTDKMSIIGFTEEGNASTPETHAGVIHVFKNPEFGTELFFGFNNELCFRSIKGEVKGPWTKLLTSGNTVTTEQLEEYKTTVEEQINVNKSKVEQCENKINQANKKIANLEQSKASVEQKATEASNKATEASSKVDAIDDKVAKANEKITSLEQSKTATEEKATEASEKATATEQKVQELEAKVNQANEKIATLEQTKTSLEERLTALEARVQELAPKQ